MTARSRTFSVAASGTAQTEHPSGAACGPLWRPATVLGLILCYLLAHLGFRLLAGPTLGLDDAEQALFAQAWSWGYRLRQPPLYTWLALPVVEVMGANILALSLVRYLLLGLTYVFLYLAARRWIEDPRLAALALFSFALFYVFGYYAHHDLTHTTALGALIAATLYIFARLVERPHAGNYALLGVCLGLGMLTKYNYVMLAAGLAVTCLLRPAFRPLVRNRKTALALAIAGVIAAPSAIWTFAHGGTPGAVSHDILAGSDARGFGETLVAGTLALLESILVFPQPFLPVFLVVFGPTLWRALRTPAWQEAPGQAAVTPGFLGALIAATLGLHWLLVPAFEAVAFTERWMHAALMPLPIFGFALVERGRPSRRAITVYLVIVALVVAAAFGARAVRLARGADHCGKCREMVPFAELAADLRAAGFAGGTIVATPEEFHIGGNLRVAFPGSRIIDPAYPTVVWPAPAGDGQCLVVWNASGAAADAPPAASLAYLHEQLDVPEDAARVSGQVDALMFGSTTRRYTLGYMLLPEGPGQCR